MASKGREVHVDVEREAMISPAAHDAEAERGDLGAVRRRRPARPACARAPRSEEVDHGLLEQPYEALDLDAAAREVDQRVDHDLAGAVIGDLAAAIGLHHRDGRREREGLEAPCPTV